MTIPVRAKQSLGQNFLVDPNVADKIVQALNLTENDIVVEIGPGTGILTERIQPKVKHLYAVEIDQRLTGKLTSQMGHCANVTIIHKDFLQFPRETLELDRKCVIVGNVPYNITSPIFFKVLEERQSVKKLVMLIQKEVAQRVVSRPNTKDYGILAVMSQTFAQVELLFNVKPTVFKPMPKVESSLVQWIFTKERAQKIIDEKLFQKLVKQAFGLRRKMLRKSIKNILPEKELSFDFTRRPEHLSIDEWIWLANACAQH